MIRRLLTRSAFLVVLSILLPLAAPAQTQTYHLSSSNPSTLPSGSGTTTLILSGTFPTFGSTYGVCFYAGVPNTPIVPISSSRTAASISVSSDDFLVPGNASIYLALASDTCTGTSSGLSNALPFVISVQQEYSIADSTPGAIGAGSGDTLITLSGSALADLSNFQFAICFYAGNTNSPITPSSADQFGGTFLVPASTFQIPPSLFSSSQYNASIYVIPAYGTCNGTNPGISNTFTLPIAYPTLDASSLAALPINAIPGSAPTNFEITGTNFSTTTQAIIAYGSSSATNHAGRVVGNGLVIPTPIIPTGTAAISIKACNISGSYSYCSSSLPIAPYTLKPTTTQISGTTVTAGSPTPITATVTVDPFTPVSTDSGLYIPGPPAGVVIVTESGQQGFTTDGPLQVQQLGFTPDGSRQININVGSGRIGSPGTDAAHFHTLDASPTPVSPVITTPFTSLTADFNKDGLTDVLFVQNAAGTMHLFLGTSPAGSLQFEQSLLFARYCFSLPSVAVGDFNGDGYPDIAYVCGDSGGGASLNIAYNLGDGTFDPNNTTFIASTGGTGIIAAADLDHNGTQDIAFAGVTSTHNGTPSTYGIQTFLNTAGNGTFTTGPVTPTRDNPGTQIVAKDLNNDGAADLVLLHVDPSSGATTVQTYQNDTTGAFTAASSFPVAASTSKIFVTSFTDTSSYPDIAVVEPGVGIAIALNGQTGDLSFGTPVVTSMPAIQDAVPGDIDADTLTDFVYNDGTDISVLYGQGDGTFNPTSNTSYSTSFVAAGIPTTGTSLVAATDLNNDSFADILAVVADSGDVTSYFASTFLTTGSLSTLDTVTPALSTGSHTLTATYAGNINLLGSAGSGTVTVNAPKVNAILSVYSTPPQQNGYTSAPISPGSPYAFTFSILGNQGVPLPTGTMTVYSGDIVLASTSTLTPGTANSSQGSISFGTQAIGTQNFTFRYSGDTNYNTASGTFIWTITQVTSETNILTVTSGGSPVTTIPVGSVVTLTATVFASGSPITPGQVQFCDAAATFCSDVHLLGTAQLSGTGTASIKFVPSIGSHSYKSVFVGTNNYAASASANSSLTVTGAYPTTTTIAQSGTPRSYSLTATTTGFGNSAALAPTGTIPFLDTSNSNAVLGSAPLGAATYAFGLNNSSNPAVRSETVATGDFNGDGILDLIVASDNAPSLTVLTGNGDGSFTTGTPIALADLQSGPIVVADFNADGKLDLAVPTNGNNVVILLGNGAGGFTFGPSVSIAGPASAIVAGDFNGDGIRDLALAVTPSDASPQLQILLGSGDGTFTASPNSPYIAYSTVSSLATGDFDSDGIADIIVASDYTGGPNVLTLFLGNGDGTFHAPDIASPGGDTPSNIVVADFNGDGKADIATTNQASNTVSILLGNGNATFTAGTAPSAGTNPFAATLGDFNGDGKVDLAVTNVSGNEPTILLGNGDGTFATQPASGLTSGYSFSLAAGDFNGDGQSDLAVPNLSTIAILLAQSTQTATATVTGINPIGTGTHQVDAAYPGDTHFRASTSTTTPLTGTTLTPIINWDSPTTNPVYGAPLSAAQLNAQATDGAGNILTGTYVYTPAAGTILPAGTSNDTVVFTPTGTSAATYGPATKTITITVNPAPVTVSLTVSPNPILAGQNTSLTATVTATPASVVTGTVAFQDGGVPIGTATLVGGSATIPYASTTVGSHPITASYNFDNNTLNYNYSRNTSGSVTLTVKSNTPIINWASPTTNPVYGAPLSAAQLNAQATDGAGNILTGTYVYTPAAGTILPAGTSNDTVVFTPTGTSAATYGPATKTITITVNPAPVTVSLTVSPNPILAGQNTSLTATVTATPASVVTGTVAFQDGGVPIGTATLVGGSATIPYASTTVGSHPITASYNFDNNTLNYNYSRNTAGPVTLTVSSNIPVITWTPAPSTITYGTLLTAAQLDAIATTSLGVTLPGSFVYNHSAGDLLTAGTQTLSVTFTPTNPAYTTVTKTATITVNKANPPILWTPATPILTTTILGSSILDATSTVPGVFVYTPAAGPNPGNPNFLPAGNDTLSTTFTPTDTANYNTITTTVTEFVAKDTPTIVLQVSPGNQAYNPSAQEQLTAFVDGTNLLPSGTLQFFDNGRSISGPVSGSFTSPGAANLFYGPFPIPSVSAGTHSYTATFSGDATYNGTSSAATPVTITQITPILSWATPASVPYGTRLSTTQLNAQAKDASGTSIPGSFTYTPALDFLPPAGTQTLSATFVPTDAVNYATPANPITTTLQVTKAPQTITFTPPTTPVAAGTSVTLTATGGASGNPVTFSVTSGPATVSGSNGSTLSYTGGGTVVVAANQAGSSNYDAAPTVTNTVSVNAARPSSYTAPNTPVGTTSATQTAYVNFTTDGTLSSIAVLTKGAANLDFKLVAGGTCATGVAYTAGQACSVLYSFNPLSPGSRLGAIVLKDASSAVLGTSYLQGTGTGPVGIFTSATPSLTIESLQLVRGLSTDGAGNLFALETATGQIDKFAAGGLPQTVLGNVGTNGGATAVDGAGNLYVSSYADNKIYELVGGSGTPTPIATTPETPDDNLNVDGSGNLYFTGYGSGSIYMVATGNHVVSTLSTGIGDRVIGMGVDAAGNLYPAGFNTNTLYKLPVGSSSLTPLISGQGIVSPHGVTLDAAGNIYVVNIDGSNVLRFAAGTLAETVLPAAGQRGIAIDGSGNLFTITSDSTISIYPRTASPTLTFPATQVGTTSTSLQNAEFENDGTDPLVISSYLASSNFGTGSANTCATGSFAAGATCTISAVFQPATTGTLTGAINISDNTLNVAGKVQPVPLTGSASPGTKTITFPAPSSPVSLGASTSLTAFTSDGDPVTYTVLSGSATIIGSTITYTTAGTVTIAADSPATSNYNAAPRVTRTVIVNQATPTLAWTPPASINQGTPLSGIQLNATASLPGAFTYNPPSGTVLLTGTHTLTAVFTPTDSIDYKTATISVPITVSSPLTTTILTSTASPSQFGQPITLAATILRGGTLTTPLTGTVSFYDGETLIGKAITVVANESGATASQTVSTLSTGTHHLSAIYSGDANYQTSANQAPLAQTVNIAPVTLSWTPTVSTIPYGTGLSPAQLDATPISSYVSPVPGLVTYSPTTGAVLNAGTQTLSATFTPTDTADFLPAAGSTIIHVTQATPTITWNAPASIVQGTPLSNAQLNAVVTGITGAILPGTTTYTPATGTKLQAGTTILSVLFTPTDAVNYTTASTNVPITVSIPNTTTVLTSNLSPSQSAQLVTLTATVAQTGTSTQPLTGTVTFLDSGKSIGIGTLTNGVATLPISTLSVGQHVLTATYSGSASFAGSTSSAITQTVTSAAVTIAWTPNPSTIPYGTALALGAELNATASSASTPSVPGTFVYSPAAGAILTAGTQTLTTTFTPTDAVNFASRTASATLTVTQAKPVITWTPPAAITQGTPLSATQLNAVVKGVDGAILPGTVKYTPNLNTVLPSGANTLSVAFTPTDAVDYTTATLTVPITINIPAATATLTSSANPSQYGQTTTLTATLAPGGTLTALPTGTVTFFDNGKSLGTANIAAGIATLQVSTLVTAAHTLTATYSGDTANAGSTASPLTQTVTQSTPTITWVPTVNSIVFGTQLSASQLNATAATPFFTTVPGVFTYAQPLKTVLTAGTQTLSTTFTPTDTVNFATVTQSATITVTKAKPTLTWAAPTYTVVGTALSSTQLNAAAFGVDGAALPGAFVYTPPAGTIVTAGMQSLSTLFTPTDITNYTTATATVPLNGTPVTLTSLSTTTTTLGSAALTVTLTGTGFVSDSTARANGVALATTYVNATTLTAVMPATSFTIVQTLQVSVFNPTQQQTSSALPFTVTAPPTGGTVTAPNTALPGDQPAVLFALNKTYPVDVTGTFTLTFTPTIPGSTQDPALKFTTGGTTFTFIVPAGQTATPNIPLQTGTVSGTVTLTLTLQAGGITLPTTIPRATINLPEVAPGAPTVTLVRDGRNLTVNSVGFSNTRSVTTATFHFIPATGKTLQTPDISIDVTALFAQWYSSTESQTFGSSFLYSQLFTLDDDATVVGQVTVTLSNALGVSAVGSSQ